MTDEEIMQALGDRQRNGFHDAFQRNWSDYFMWLRDREDLPETVEATQADRVAAADIGKRFAGWSNEQVSKTLDGRGDDCGMVQALARHRLASGRLEAIRKIDEALSSVHHPHIDTQGSEE